MQNRYDRDPDDDDGFGRDERERSRDGGEHRPAQPAYPQGNRFGEGNRSAENQARPGMSRQNLPPNWRGEPAYRGPSGRDASGRDYSAGRDSASGYASGGDPDYSNRGYSSRDSGARSSDRFAAYDARRGERSSEWEPSPYRGVHQEQVWTRDPSSGNLYGYEYTSRLGPRQFNAGDETGDRWRQGSADPSRRSADRERSFGGSSPYGASRNPAGHFGKGPKGYVRSDERIREDVCDRLSDDDEIDGSEISVTVKAGEVTLEGTVVDRHSKHRAEDVAESVSGVREVINHLRAKKNLLHELGDKLTGDDDAEHHGHRGSGTRNSPSGTAQKSPQSH